MARPRAHLDTEALARAFAADGLRGTAIDHVAACAGLAKPTLYERGGDKEELFALAIEGEVERLIERLGTARGAGDRLAGVAAALDGYVREQPDGARLIFLTAHHERSRVAGRVKRALARVPIAVEEALDTGDAALLAAALLGGTLAALDGGPSVRALAALLSRGAPARVQPPPELWTA